MGKAILVIDMPSRCGECPICASYAESAWSPRDYWCPVMENKDVNPNNKSDWCPLKPIPKKLYIGKDGIMDCTNDYPYGWNACINEILNT